MGADPLPLLLETTVAGSLALVLVLAIRRPVRRLLGAGAAYVLWACVPIALVGVMLPGAAEVPVALPVAWQAGPAVAVAAPGPASTVDWHAVLGALWLAGASATVAMLAWQQRRFRYALGPVRRREDGLFQSGSARSGLPAVAGVLRPRILLPADFEQRYTPAEQALVVQHERLHVRRGDLFANALAALLRCLFWFNPLLLFALVRFRLDQELACDEAVIARNPRARRQYGEAMLKTEFDQVPLPLGCHWQARHPIKERIEMLKRPTPTPMHWMAAIAFAIALSVSTGYVAWAAQPAAATAMDAQGYAIDVRMDVDGRARRLQLREHAGRAFALRSDEPGRPVWEVELTLKPVDGHAGQVLVGGRLRADGRTVSEPALVASLGKPATIQVSTLDGSSVLTLELDVTRASNGSAPPSPSRGAAAAASAPPTPAITHGTADAAASGARGADRAAIISDKMEPPRYPEEAARQGIEGNVMLVVTVEPDGSVGDVRIEQASPAGVFDAAVLEAVRTWKFQPAVEDGTPVRGRVRVPVTFSTEVSDTGSPPGTAGGEGVHGGASIPGGRTAGSACDASRDGSGRSHCGHPAVASR